MRSTRDKAITVVGPLVPNRNSARIGCSSRRSRKRHNALPGSTFLLVPRCSRKELGQKGGSMPNATGNPNPRCCQGAERPIDFVVGVDLDGVCADFAKGLRPIAAEWLGVDEATLTATPSRDYPEWKLNEAGGFEALYRYAVTRRELFRKLPPVEGASLALRRLWTHRRIRIRIITYRLYFEFVHALATTQTIEWLDQHDFPYWDLCFMRDKHEVGANLYIEDSVSNVRALREVEKDVIVFATSQNTELGDERAHDWQEIEERVLEAVSRWERDRADP
jgi:5'(3')-deoxyribonucleotidase